MRAAAVHLRDQGLCTVPTELLVYPDASAVICSQKENGCHIVERSPDCLQAFCVMERDWREIGGMVCLHRGFG